MIGLVTRAARLVAAMAVLAAEIVVLAGVAGSAFGQTATDPLTGYGRRPEVGGTRPGSVQTPLIRSSSDVEILRHRDFAGKPCLSVGGFARPFTTNPNLFDHVISTENNCPKAIKLQVCYYKATDCVPLEVPGYGRKEAVLGTMPAQKDFRFEFREKF
ncbi:hypothetical protein JQ604_01000 [Bradyrhizobium jicamae]|nr:hypothetical protein [Bradyrhizobium jicamae]